MKVLTVQQKNIARVGVVFLLMLSLSFASMASKGGGDEKEKKGYVLKFNGFEFKKHYNNPISIMRGATYQGTYNYKVNGNEPQNDKNQHSIITYKKGNTIIILPVKPKGLIQKFKVPSKEGFKF